jgi:hypothetical protein
MQTSAGYALKKGLAAGMVRCFFFESRAIGPPALNPCRAHADTSPYPPKCGGTGKRQKWGGAAAADRRRKIGIGAGDIITLVPKQGPKVLTSSISMLLRLFTLGEELGTIIEDQSALKEKLKEYFAIFIPFSDLINKMTFQLNYIRKKLLEEMDI